MRTFKSRVMRPVDLAREAGISTQQIRNYVDAGILPPVERSPTGYRRFHARHRQAVRTYRALAPGYGWNTAREIMQAVHADDVPRALALVDGAHAEQHRQRTSLRDTADALQAVAGADDEPISGSPLRIGEAAARLGVRRSALRVWESHGLLAPARVGSHRSYAAADVRDARMILMLRHNRYRLDQIRPVLDGLRRTGSTDELRAAVARREVELAERTARMLDGAGRLYRYLTDPSGTDPSSTDPSSP